MFIEPFQSLILNPKPYTPKPPKPLNPTIPYNNLD